ncbi:hypothetical protein [Commensalibacter papalotli (ex Botero et al. 2024)]|uniref:Outer membrane protein OmpA and related peptidoglycan-associated (Lipo)proteins (OmpA) (PDB:1OAP) n=1 Tax=Commensalibacter papalotli (ex Botero et al. 2024) TaxID=2972766 RepID=A0ABN8WG60_9PROT|nr:hypothetical protein [Commensalibacter papalotli (ex Botero et al. 2024)]CAI3956930.1 Outer membrane protein OmpA and related peptidoglycan-associated (lipo)proteins (OmpA) (PDB:1OAP) [Commensalibacter papalotli (ex Botero et al. 2024)]CAI3957555.1 Outer membrane protein OmpA and related peptidoglycan-associated (lipo)proteins (OmpA) (PDB:1OAP) [Commensalibacter papalotli (ex Botero et al. 2024)]
MPFIRQPFLRYSLLMGFLCLEGCANSPVIKTPVGWYHNLEGGIVSQPRLPVPGHDQTYPYVGLTPTQPPALPSPALRNEITDSLTKDRTLSDWQNTVAPLDIPKIPPAPQQPVAESKPNTEQAKTAANNQNSEESSASFDAVGQDPAPEANAADKQPVQNTAKPVEKPKESKKAPPPPPEPVVLPELRAKIDEQAVVIPAIPVNPPPPSKFPGFNIPSDANLPSPFKPAALPLEAPKGELITFPIDSDTPNPKQDGLINSIAWQRHGRTIFVHGYGDAYSIEPKDQSQALSLGLLRAKTVAKMLIAHNVPESSIVIRAHAIGHGVRIRMDE